MTIVAGARIRLHRVPVGSTIALEIQPDRPMAVTAEATETHRKVHPVNHPELPEWWGMAWDIVLLPREKGN
jgi:hypothetical protein